MKDSKNWTGFLVHSYFDIGSPHSTLTLDLIDNSQKNDLSHSRHRKLLQKNLVAEL